MARQGDWVHQIRFFGPLWEAMAVTSQDRDFDGVSEVSVLAKKDDGTAVATQIKDSITKEALDRIVFPLE